MMAEYSREHKDVVGILTNDSDMALMSGCKMIHYKFFDRKDTLELYRPILKRSHVICCDILKPENLARDLKIDEKCLPALSILCGNDFTGVLHKKYGIQEILGFKYPFVSNISVWIKHHEKECMSADAFIEIKQINDIREKCSEFRSAIVHTYNFYQSKKSIMAVEINNINLDRHLLAVMKTGILW